MNALGLFISMIAALLLLVFPLAVTPIAYDKKTKKHYLGFGWFSVIVAPWWKVLLAKLSPCLLVVGFGLQLMAVFLGS
jgi:hypothetical protein